MSSSALKTAVTGQAAAAPQRTIMDYLADPRLSSRIGAVAGKFLTPERMLSLCINAVKRTPLLAKCDPQTVLGAMMSSAALGLEPNTVQQQAFLIPYKKRKQIGREWVDVYECQFQVGARGFVTLAYRSPSIKSLSAGAIHEHDLFEHMEGSQTFLKYAKTLRERGDLIGAFSHVHLANGNELACVLPLAELHKIRSKSETYKFLAGDLENAKRAGDQKELRKIQQKFDETPWVMWEDDMATKSAIKKHAKQLPLAAGDAMAQAAAIDDRSETGVIDMAAMSNPDALRDVIDNGAEPPALPDDASPSLDVSGEAFGTRDRVHAEAAAAPPPPAQAPAAAPAPAPAQDWEPSPAELEAIRARELAEAQVDQAGRTPAAGTQAGAPAAGPQPRTARAQRGEGDQR